MSLSFAGLRELEAALAQLPADLTDEARPIVETAVDVTEAQLKQSYPLGDTGNLRGGVSSEIQASGRFGVLGVVQSTSPHAHLWEFGTENRKTRLGWKRGHVNPHYNQGLVGIAIRNRRRMYDELLDLVRRHGFTVTG